jgi:hypothetical protein
VELLVNDNARRILAERDFRFSGWEVGVTGGGPEEVGGGDVSSSVGFERGEG